MSRATTRVPLLGRLDRLARARAPSMGRAVLTRGDHAAGARAARASRQDAARVRTDPAAGCSAVGAGRPAATAARSGLSTRSGSARRRAQHTGYRDDPGRSSTRSTASWTGTASTGASGFIQYQLAVPLGARGHGARVAARLSAARCPSFLDGAQAVRAGEPRPAVVPAARMDARPSTSPPRWPGLGPLLDGLDELVVERGRAGLPFQGQPAAARPARGHVPAARRVAVGARRARPGRRPAQRSFSRRSGLT